MNLRRIIIYQSAQADIDERYAECETSSDQIWMFVAMHTIVSKITENNNLGIFVQTPRGDRALRFIQNFPCFSSPKNGTPHVWCIL
jgi:hypothetical protein